MNYYVYVLRSIRNSKQYIGSTAKNPEMRLIEHNTGANTWTKQNRPFTLIYSETFSSRTEARKRENFLKSGQGLKWLDDNIRGEVSGRGGGG